MSHIREHGSLLAIPERQALIWMARRLPAWVNSDHLSALALAAMAAAGLSFAVLRWSPWAALGVVAWLALNWFGDSLDGTLARVRNTERPRYGFYVDHVIDLAGTAFLLAGLACSGIMSPIVAVCVLTAYLLVSAEAYLATHAAGIFRLSFLGFGPTELRIVLAMGVAKAAWTPWISVGGLGHVLLFDVGGLVAAAGLGAAFTVSAIRNARTLYLAEPLPRTALDSRAA